MKITKCLIENFKVTSLQ